jgi:hypothetical protein
MVGRIVSAISETAPQDVVADHSNDAFPTSKQMQADLNKVGHRIESRDASKEDVVTGPV